MPGVCLRQRYRHAKLFNNSQVPAVWEKLASLNYDPENQAETLREVSRIIMFKAAEFMDVFRLLDELILCAEIKQ
jgi:hypothetical protein